MKLIGIAIKVDGKKKFIGKVGIAPARYGVPGPIVGTPIFYREAPYKHAYSYRTKSLGIDAAATDLAEHFGAIYAVTYCKDKKAIYISSMPELRKTFTLDLGEFPQYRLGVHLWAKFPATEGIKMGYTYDVRLITPDRNKRPLSGSELKGHGKQLSLFDE